MAAVSLLDRSLAFLRRGAGFDRVEVERIAAWRRRAVPSLREKHAATRYVVVDVETSGLDTRADSVIAIGAAGVEGSELRVDDVFSVVLRQTRTSAHDNVLIHQIGGEAQRSGEDPARAVADFLEFAGRGPLVAFHAEFDRAMLKRAVREHLALRVESPWIDVAALLPLLFPDGGCESLDQWIAHFGLEAFERHDALADAWVTAELFLIALAAADRRGMTTAGDLVAAQTAHRWLGRR